ncbi:MAG: aldo/keto reductase [Xanthobacteraceae bacterium]
MPLRQRPLGSSGVLITKTGFGACAIGGGARAFGWGPQDDAVSLATMRHALGLGVNWTDTAAVYGLGHSEEVVGRLLANGRHPSAQWPSPSALRCDARDPWLREYWLHASFSVWRPPLLPARIRLRSVHAHTPTQGRLHRSRPFMALTAVNAKSDVSLI